MADMQRLSLIERDIEQAITALKRGAHLLKYGRRGKPKFCPFRLSSDESTLIWYYGKEEKQLELFRVSKIIPGQRTAIFKRYPQPEKEYQSFSLIYDDGSLDLICKDKDEAEVWFTGLKALIARCNSRKLRNDSGSESASSGSPGGRRIASTMSLLSPDNGSENNIQSRLGKVFAEVVSLSTAAKNFQLAESTPSVTSLPSSESSNAQNSGAEALRTSLSSAVSSSSLSSCIEDYDNLGDVYIWGEGTGNGIMGGGSIRVDRSSIKISNLPKLLESTMVLDVQTIACGRSHAVLVTKQGEIFSWGEEVGGRLGHGVASDTSQPKLVEALSGKGIDTVACGMNHTCAVTISGELYTWGYGGLLGHGSDVSHWIPKKVNWPVEGFHVSFVACGPWHTALLTNTGQVFTFGDGTFGVLGHGDRCRASSPREVEALKGLKTVRIACGAWHTAAVVELMAGSCSGSRVSKKTISRKVFTWGDGDKGRLGHGDGETRLVPESIATLDELDFFRVACGDDFTVALTTSGQIYVTGSTTEKVPFRMEGNICAEEVACGAHHIAVLTTSGEVHTWGRNTHGQLGHGDHDDRGAPTLVNFLKDKQVRSIACGSNFTAAICLHKGISGADNSMCSGCRNPFTFIRKRHNCYNCGLVFCSTCSSRKSVKASLAPSRSKPYRVCDDCFTKLQKTSESTNRLPTVRSEGLISKSCESERESGGIRLPGIGSRLSSAESFKSDRNSTFSLKLDSNENRVLHLHDGSTQRRGGNSSSPSGGYLSNSRQSESKCTSPAQGRSALPSPSASPSQSSSLLFSPTETFPPAIFPDAKIRSQSPSPRPRRSATPLPSSSPSCFTLDDDLRSCNYSLSLEVKSLKAQVERLTTKSQLLEAELQRKLKQLKDATVLAEEEAEKNKAAKEVIKSLSTQLKEMAERVPDEQVTSNNTSTNERMTNNYCPSNGYHVESAEASPDSSVSSDSSTPSSLSNGTRGQANKPERTIQDEPGVYVTITSSLPNGANELRRIRFSRKLFTEAEAEKWWSENGTKLCQRHNVEMHGSESL